MPLITDIKKNIDNSKVFKKKLYRPWDHELVNSSDSTENNIPLKHIEDKEFNQNTSPNLNHFTIQNLQKELRNLFGAQKIIMHYLLNQIEENNNEFVITKCICMDELATKCNIPINTIRAMLQRLKIKGLLETHENKTGRGGYARYKFIQQVYTFFSEKLNQTF